MEKKGSGGKNTNLTLQILIFCERTVIRFFAIVVKVSLVMLAVFIGGTGGFPIVTGFDVEGFRSVAPPFERIDMHPLATDAARGLLLLMVGGFAMMLVLPAVEGLILALYTFAFMAVATVRGVLTWVVADLPIATVRACGHYRHYIKPVLADLRDDARREVDRQRAYLQVEYPATCAKLATVLDRVTGCLTALPTRVRLAWQRARTPSNRIGGALPADARPERASLDDDPGAATSGLGRLNALWIKALDKVHGPLPPYVRDRSTIPTAKRNST